MKKTLLILLFAAPVVSSCSYLPGFSDCDKAVSNNLLQEVFEKNMREVEPSHPLQLGFCQLKDLKPQLCDIKVEVSDVKEISKSSFSASCKASVRYSATLRLDDYQKERKRLIDEVNAKAKADLAQAKQTVIQTFEKFGVSYTDADLKEGITKREAAIRKEQEAALSRFNPSGTTPASVDDQIRNIFFKQSNAATMPMPEEPKKKSYYLVADVAYTVSESKDYLNLGMDDMKLVSKGE